MNCKNNSVEPVNPLPWIQLQNGSGNIKLNANALAVSGTNLIVGNSHGILLSTNNGMSWRAVHLGLTDTIVTSFAVSGTKIFAGTFGEYFFQQTTAQAGVQSIQD